MRCLLPALLTALAVSSLTATASPRACSHPPHGTQPFTLEVDGQAGWTTDGHGQPATVHTDYTCFLTLQRMA